MSWLAAGMASGAATQAAVMYIKKRRDQKKDEKNRQKYVIPPEIAQNLTQAQQESMQGMPEEQYQNAINSMQQKQQASIAGMKGRKGGLAGITDINSQMQQQEGDLAVMDSQMRTANLDKLKAARGEMANYKDQAFQYNVVNPYYEHIARRDANDAQLSQSLSNSAGIAAGGGMGTGKSKSAPAAKGGDQTSSNYWNQKSQANGLTNYNPKSNNGSIYNEPNNMV